MHPWNPMSEQHGQHTNDHDAKCSNLQVKITNKTSNESFTRSYQIEQARIIRKSKSHFTIDEQYWVFNKFKTQQMSEHVQLTSWSKSEQIAQSPNHMPRNHPRPWTNSEECNTMISKDAPPKTHKSATNTHWMSNLHMWTPPCAPNCRSRKQWYFQLLL